MLNRKKPIRKVSPKRRAANDEYAVVREIYLRENPRCGWCWGEPAIEIHHLCSGGSRAKSLVNSDTWLGLCRDCHLTLQNRSKEKQAEVKVRQVLRAFNRLRGRAENAITLEDLQ